MLRVCGAKLSLHPYGFMQCLIKFNFVLLFSAWNDMTRPLCLPNACMVFCMEKGKEMASRHPEDSSKEISNR